MYVWPTGPKIIHHFWFYTKSLYSAFHGELQKHFISISHSVRIPVFPDFKNFWKKDPDSKSNTLEDYPYRASPLLSFFWAHTYKLSHKALCQVWPCCEHEIDMWVIFFFLKLPDLQKWLGVSFSIDEAFFFFWWEWAFLKIQIVKIVFLFCNSLKFNISKRFLQFFSVLWGRVF